MPRPREFDIDHALDQALNAFWLKGYAATSMTDLMAAMGLSKSSFYQCFGSKREALLAVLSRYSVRELAETRLHFNSAEPVAPLLAAWVRHSIDSGTCRPSQRCGCLIVNVAVELAPHDREIEEAVRHHLDKLAGFLADTIRSVSKQLRVPTCYLIWWPVCRSWPRAVWKRTDWRQSSMCNWIACLGKRIELFLIISD
jgi:TetR/AcrR family transcriptional repressor of nem operon